jgi:hypothetical protein
MLCPSYPQQLLPDKVVFFGNAGKIPIYTFEDDNPIPVLGNASSQRRFVSAPHKREQPKLLPAPHFLLSWLE